MASTAEQLARVQATIASIENGTVDSYSIGNRSATKLKLDVLYKRESELIARLARETGSGAFSVAKMGRRR